MGKADDRQATKVGQWPTSRLHVCKQSGRFVERLSFRRFFNAATSSKVEEECYASPLREWLFMRGQLCPCVCIIECASVRVCVCVCV